MGGDLDGGDCKLELATITFTLLVIFLRLSVVYASTILLVSGVLFSVPALNGWFFPTWWMLTAGFVASATLVCGVAVWEWGGCSNYGERLFCLLMETLLYCTLVTTQLYVSVHETLLYYLILLIVSGVSTLLLATVMVGEFICATKSCGSKSTKLDIARSADVIVGGLLTLLFPTYALVRLYISPYQWVPHGPFVLALGGESPVHPNLCVPVCSNLFYVNVFSLGYFIFYVHATLKSRRVIGYSFFEFLPRAHGSN